MPEIVTRAEARERGLKRYFTGKPCKHGHVAERHVDNSTCLSCRRVNERKPREKSSLLVSREAARIAGLSKFDTGRPCRRGHVSLRRVSSGKCIACAEERLVSWRLRNADALRAERAAHYRANKASINAQSKTWREKNRDKHIADVLAWRAANPEKVSVYTVKAGIKARAKTRAERALNPSRFRDYEKEYRKRRPEVRKAKDAARLARQRAAEGRGISSARIREMVLEQGGLCVYCGNRQSLTIDHVVPISRGGAHDSDNAVLACRSCNASKGNRHLVAFLLLRLDRARNEAQHDHA